MAKSKQKKFERVQHLANVTIPDLEDGGALTIEARPWCGQTFQGMPITLELGCGKGEHTLAFAAADPNRLCIGVDLKSHRLCVGAEAALAQGLDNVHFLRARAEMLERFFAPKSLSEIWLTFPDPHLKQRSIKHRLSSPEFLNIYSNLLVPGGIMHLKTDSTPLYNYTLDIIRHWGGQVLVTSTDIHGRNGSVSLGENSVASRLNPLSGKPTEKNCFAASSVSSAFEKSAQIHGRRIKYVAWTLH